MKKQQGFSPIIILIAIAVVLSVLALGAFLLTSQKKTSPSPESSTNNNPQVIEQSIVGTPECPELDYTGCDTSGDFMTWNGEYNSPKPSLSPIILK